MKRLLKTKISDCSAFEVPLLTAKWKYISVTKINMPTFHLNIIAVLPSTNTKHINTEREQYNANAG